MIRKVVKEVKSFFSTPTQLDRSTGNLLVKVQHTIRAKDVQNAIEHIIVYDEQGAEEALVKGTDKFPFAGLRPGRKTVAISWRGQPYLKKQTQVLPGKTTVCKVLMDCVPALFRIYDADLKSPLRGAQVVLHGEEHQRFHGTTDHYGEVTLPVPIDLLEAPRDRDSPRGRFLLQATPPVRPPHPLPPPPLPAEPHQPAGEELAGLEELYDDFDLDELDELEAGADLFGDEADAQQQLLEEELDDEGGDEEAFDEGAEERMAAAMAAELEEAGDDGDEEEEEGGEGRKGGGGSPLWAFGDDDARREPEPEPDHGDLEGDLPGEPGADMVDFDALGGNADSGMADFDQMGNNAESGVMQDLPEPAQDQGNQQTGVSDPAWL
eukprot:tig00020710_g13260.t1